MAVSGAGIACLVAVLYSVVPISAKTYTVGDDSGWAMAIDYSTWASGKTFTVGDTLAFNYGGGHTVEEVSKADYDSCTVGTSIQSYKTGPANVGLKTAGPHYYICGAAGHCAGGMKLAVNVSAAAASPTAPSGTPSSPTSPSTPSTPASTTNNRPTSESSSSAGIRMMISPILAVLITLIVSFVIVWVD